MKADSEGFEPSIIRPVRTLESLRASLGIHYASLRQQTIGDSLVAASAATIPRDLKLARSFLGLDQLDQSLKVIRTLQAQRQSLAASTI